MHEHAGSCASRRPIATWRVAVGLSPASLICPCLCAAPLQTSMSPSSPPSSPSPPRWPVPPTFTPSLRLGIHTTIDLSTINIDAPDVKVLGSGAYGKVYAVNVDLGRRPKALALKISQSSNAVDDRQLMVEGVAHARSTGHPSVITLHAYQGPDKPGGPHYLLMDRGHCTLEDVFTAQYKLEKDSPELAVPYTRLLRSVMAQLLPGLRHLHRCGVTHGDLKPDNLLFCNGRLCIADFGGATVDGDSSDDPICSPFYLCPEAALQQGPRCACPAWDLWAAAIIGHQMIPGGLTVGSVRYVRALRRGVCELPKGLSPALGSFLKRMLQHNPSRRLSLQNAMSHPLFYGQAWAMSDQLFVSKEASLPGSVDSSEVGSLSTCSLPDSEAEWQGEAVSQRVLSPQRLGESECEVRRCVSLPAGDLEVGEDLEHGMDQEVCARQATGGVDAVQCKPALRAIPEMDEGLAVRDVSVPVAVAASPVQGPCKGSCPSPPAAPGMGGKRNMLAKVSGLVRRCLRRA